MSLKCKLGWHDWKDFRGEKYSETKDYELYGTGKKCSRCGDLSLISHSRVKKEKPIKFKTKEEIYWKALAWESLKKAETERLHQLKKRKKEFLKMSPKEAWDEDVKITSMMIHLMRNYERMAKKRRKK